MLFGRNKSNELFFFDLNFEFIGYICCGLGNIGRIGVCKCCGVFFWWRRWEVVRGLLCLLLIYSEVGVRCESVDIVIGRNCGGRSEGELR